MTAPYVFFCMCMPHEKEYIMVESGGGFDRASKRMKRNTLLIGMLLLSLGASAQGVSFGHFQREKRAKARLTRTLGKAQQLLPATRGTIIPVEEYAEIEEDRRYRYVYAYNSNKERSSETIYLSERENGAWGEESLYAVGTYTYEYDTQGRVKTKSVTYDNTEGHFTSYRVMVTYAADGAATYTKYERDPDYGTYTEVEQWTYRADGTLASRTCENEWGSSDVTYTYDTQGNVTSYDRYSLSGGLNDVTLAYTDGTESYSNYTKHYTYDDKTGKLLEYRQMGGSMDTKRMTFEYDTYGRIVSIKEYVGEDGDAIDSPTVDGEETVTRAASAEDIVWRLAESENYTYFGNEAYSVNNPWKVVFGMDGPVLTMTYKEYDTYAEGGDANGDGIIDERDDAANAEYERVVTFTRDANGKLTAVNETDNETVAGVENGLELRIDSEGQIISLKDESYEAWTGGYDENGNWDENFQNSYYSLLEQTYTWKDGKITQSTLHDKYEAKDSKVTHTDETSYTTRYTYTGNSVTIARTEDNVDSSVEMTYLSQEGNRYMAKSWYQSGTTNNFDWETDDYVIRDIQTEDVSFIRPNLKKDREGFTVDVPVVLSRAGRVVSVGSESMSSSDFYSWFDGNYYFPNTEAEGDEYTAMDELMGIYYSISHDGDQTIASNVEGLPVFVLKGSRLLKEYKYYDIAYSAGGSMGSTEVTRTVTIPAGQAYDEISYLYDDGGLLVGQQLVSVDEEGVRTGEVTLEYRYDTTGVIYTELTAQGRICLNGRTLGLDNEATFSIWTVSGQTLAAGVSSYTFDQPGIYVITTGSTSMKLTVK